MNMKLHRRLTRAVLGAAMTGALLAGAVLQGPRALSASDTVPMLEVREQSLSRAVSAEGTLQAVHSTLLSQPEKGLFKIERAVPHGSRVDAGDVVVRFAGDDLEARLADGHSDRASARTRLAKESALVAAAQRDRQRAVELARAELAQSLDFDTQDEALFSRHQLIQSEIDEQLWLARSAHAERAERIESKLSESRLELLRVGRRRADLTIERAEKGLRGLELRAPHAGVVLFVDSGHGQPFQVGDPVWGGRTVATLPDLSDMEAVVHVLSADAGGIVVGMPASVLIEAHPETRYAAKVESVDTLAKPITRGSPTQYFAVTLELERTEPALMKPGARVSARLVVDELSGLVVPRQAVFERDGQSVVYVRRAARWQAVPVELGAITLGRAVVTRGLAAGDRIALIDPLQQAAAAPPAGALPRAHGSSAGPESLSQR